MLDSHFRHLIGKAAALMLGLILLAACGGSSGTPSESAANEPVAEVVAPEPTVEPTTEPIAAPVEEESGLVRIEGGDGPPFYARFGENETFGDAEWVAIVFYRPTDCIPDEFNLNTFFDLPGDSGPGAFGCAPTTTDVVEHWVNGPGTDPAPAISEMTGRGAVPVWFFSRADINAANADGVVTIAELESMASRRVGTAETYTEYLKPSQSNTAPLIRFTAEGALEDGGDFLVDVSYGDPDVADHTTIELP